ncbi:hypothetical protein FOZ60_014130 [Perkinsus olseni]|uniref:Calcium-dependent protein kinase 2 n=1 Tax=Perkinsus olseni TaxID=32597 RepID=A0A7J6N8D5_PEROL|nr:hypothetical protein FOZ60_014130 [Perkinsus olseni]
MKRDMLYDEINIYLPLSHPNIVRLNEVYEEPGDRIILVMEACLGGELYERLAKLNRYSERDAAKILRHILYAVSYLHSLNICHRDLKLENFVYTDDTEDSRLKLCDFGFGTIVHGEGPDGDSPLTAALGSVHYVAPEVLEGRYGLQCDMWSVGVILYMLLSGTPPFDGSDDREVAEAVRHAPLKLSGSRWDCISSSAKDLVRNLLCRDPTKRLTATQALQHEWCGSTDILKLNTASNEIDVDVLRTMHAFTRCSAIQRAALGLIAQKRGDDFVGIDDKLKSMEDTFKRMDTNHDGVITLSEFENAVRSHVEMGEHEAEKIFRDISSCSSTVTQSEPVIHYSDFLAATIYSLRNRESQVEDTPESSSRPRGESSTIWHWTSEDIRSAYEAFDTERKGYVTKEDLLRVLGCGGRELERILAAAGFDPKHTRRIDFDDFSKLLNCQNKSIIEFPRPDSASEDELLKQTKAAEFLERDAYFAGLDDYDEELLAAEGICASTRGTPRSSVVTLRPSQRSISAEGEPVQQFLRRMRTWPVFYPLYGSLGLLPSYEDYNYDC